MKVSHGRALGLLFAVGLATGCHKVGLSPKQSPAGAPHYSPARDGLPTTKIWKSQIAFGDINGDGLPDLGAVSRLADGPWIWKNDGNGHWTDASAGLPRESFCGGGMAFGDINNDGKMDVAIADHCRGVFAYLGDGTGHWTAASAGLPNSGSEDVALGDFNHDGCLDAVITGSSDEGIRVFNGNCKGVWKESSAGLPHGEWANGVTVADMNGDGNLDIIAAYAAGPRVWLNDGAGKWHEASEGLPAPDIHGLYWGIAVGDVNGDGRPDIVSGAALPGAEVFIQDANGKYHNSASTQCAGGTRSGSFCIADAECPGGTCASAICKGVCTSGVAGNKCAKESDCSGGTCQQHKCVVPAAGHSCLSDSECPGASCKHGSNFNAACRIGGDNQCPEGSCAPVNNTHGIPPMNALGVAVGDLNNDGKMDLVVAGKTNLEEIGGVYGIFAFLGDGAGNWQLLENDGLPSTGRERTWGVGLADINKDGVLGIAAAFGDVLSPTWHSGAARKMIEANKQKDKDKAKEAKSEKPDKSKKAAPERGMFGGIEVWRGQIPGK